MYVLLKHVQVVLLEKVVICVHAIEACSSGLTREVVNMCTCY